MPLSRNRKRGFIIQVVGNKQIRRQQKSHAAPSSHMGQVEITNTGMLLTTPGTAKPKPGWIVKYDRIAEIKRRSRVEAQIKQSKGLRQFNINGQKIWALNRKNAERKAVKF